MVHGLSAGRQRNADDDLLSLQTANQAVEEASRGLSAKVNKLISVHRTGCEDACAQDVGMHTGGSE